MNLIQVMVMVRLMFLQSNIVVINKGFVSFEVCLLMNIIMVNFMIHIMLGQSNMLVFWVYERLAVASFLVSLGQPTLRAVYKSWEQTFIYGTRSADLFLPHTSAIIFAVGVIESTTILLKFNNVRKCAKCVLSKFCKIYLWVNFELR